MLLLFGQSQSSEQLQGMETAPQLSSEDFGYLTVLLQLEASRGRGQPSCAESLGKGLRVLEGI